MNNPMIEVKISKKGYLFIKKSVMFSLEKCVILSFAFYYYPEVNRATHDGKHTHIHG
jgi:hypothetical protein